ncbi:HNH endonuclease [Kamptonema sp. UHCC 0994]|uniref:HNH endonuclease n=1 Tax=Kamptonema sp. UHCC 0994 TaxID=3031329 RepID=UPI0023B9FBD2|nr:HNH endonuclease [Kamptonema sp. UHCC 0994]MDF0552591.1 HNH endonuclease [Kamptonema sp. UHCC 0994]
MVSGQNSDNKNLAYYSDCFSQIKVYKNQKQGGEALNQPVLLLSVIDLIAQGLIQDNLIPISDELINTFKKYWDLLTSDPFESSDFALPFFHLKNRKPKFWYLKFSEQYDGGRPQTINTLKQAVDHAKIDEELFYLLKDADARKELIDTLITAWFSSSQKQLDDILNINQSLQNSSLDELENLESPNATQQPKIYLRKSFVREAFFRKSIVHLYDYRCAFCRLKVTRTLKQSIVDGAHIKPFSEFYDSQVNNGLSLCKNHHWAFDKGWFTIDNQYKIIVASDLEEDSPYNRSMKEFQGEFILLPTTEQYFPRLEAIQWHRKNVFKA